MRSYRLEPDAFVLRTPIFSLDDFVHLTAGIEETTDERPHATSREAILRQNLVTLLSRPMFREGLYLASPELWRSLESFLSGDTHPTAALESALIAYASRCCSRATPFGLFAGYSLGTVEPRTSLALETRDRDRRHTQLHADTLSAIVRTLQLALQRELDYCVNTSLYRDGPHIYYVQATGSNTDRRYDYVRVASTPPLVAVIDAARRRSSFETLVSSAWAAKDAEGRRCFDRLDDAIAFVRDLIVNDLLISTLVPPVTGEMPLNHLLAELGRIGQAAEPRMLLANVKHELARLDEADVASPKRGYDNVRRKLEPLCGDDALVRFHVDLVKPVSHLTLGHNVVAALRYGIDVLHRIAPDRRDERLERFATAFQDCYGDEEVPLVEALDEERGIGFGERSADSIGLSMPISLHRESNRDRFPPWTARDRALDERIQSIRDGTEAPLALDESDLAMLADGLKRPLPESFYVNASLAATSCEAVDRGDFDLFIRHVVGPCGGRLLSRFAQMDPNLQLLLRRHAEAEHLVTNSLCAEIVHLPVDGLANVVGRPTLRDFEIPFLGRSGLPKERQIPVDELTVSIQGGSIVLRWPRRDVEVAPRLTSAHNYYQRLPAVYQFLCALQNDTTCQSRGWVWGALESRDFLPRVTYKRLVFARARWRVVPTEIFPLANIANTATRDDAVRRWRKSRRMPRYVCLADADRELLVDFDNSLSVESFLRFARRRSHSVFEHFPGVDQAIVSDRTGRMAHEFITMWVADSDTQPVPLRRAIHRPTLTTVAPATAARYAPGTEWVYLKIYRGRADLDDVLLVARDAIVRPLVGRGEIAQWFFIRYADPHPHIRMRLRVSKPEMIGSCLSVVFAALSAKIASREIGRIQIDTYFPELNRYGGRGGMEVAHRIFAADSAAALDALAALAQRRRSWLRVGATFLSVDTFLDDWDLQPADKASFVRSLKDRLARLERVDRDGKLSLGRLFRIERDRVRNLLMACDHDEVMVAVRDALSRRATIIRSAVAEIRQLDAAGMLHRTVTDLLQTFVHLTINRFLRNPHNEHELVVCDLLCRAYAEILANPPASSGAAAAAGGNAFPG